MQEEKTGQVPRSRTVPVSYKVAVQDAAAAVGVDVGVDVEIHNGDDAGVAVAGTDASATRAGACDDDDGVVPCYLVRMVPSPGRFPTVRFAVAGFRVSTFCIRSPRR